jgi:hypothetical protein
VNISLIYAQISSTTLALLRRQQACGLESCVVGRGMGIGEGNAIADFARVYPGPQDVAIIENFKAS